MYARLQLSLGFRIEFVATPVKAQPIRSRKLFAQRVLRAPVLQRIPWLTHAFSIRTGGRSTTYGSKSLNLGFTKDDQRERVEANRKLFLSAAGAVTRNKPWPLVTLRQVH